MSTSINSNLMTEVYPAHLAAPPCIPPKPNKMMIKQHELVNKAPEMHILHTLEQEMKGGKNQPDFCLEMTKMFVDDQGYIHRHENTAALWSAKPYS